MLGNIDSAMSLAVEGGSKAAAGALMSNPTVYERLETIIVSLSKNRKIYTADDVNLEYERVYGKELTHQERLGSSKLYARLRKQGIHSNIETIIQNLLWAGNIEKARILYELQSKHKYSTIVRASGKQRHGTLTTVWYSNTYKN